MVQVYSYIYNGNGTPKSNVLGWAKILQQPVYTSGYIVSHDSGIKSYSDSNGLIQWYLPSGATVSFTIPDVNMINNIVTIPSSGVLLSSL